MKHYKNGFILLNKTPPHLIVEPALAARVDIKPSIAYLASPTIKYEGVMKGSQSISFCKESEID